MQLYFIYELYLVRIIGKMNKRCLTESFMFNRAPCLSNRETASTQPRFTALIIAPPRP